MSDAFGKIVAFILVAVLLFVVPVNIAMENQKISEKMYLYTEAVSVCEQVKNTGILTSATYESLSRMAAGVFKAYKLEIWSMDSEGRITVSDEITPVLSGDGRYEFSEGDYIRIKITDSSGIQVYCGGMIKYNETD